MFMAHRRAKIKFVNNKKEADSNGGTTLLCI